MQALNCVHYEMSQKKLLCIMEMWSTQHSGMICGGNVYGPIESEDEAWEQLYKMRKVEEKSRLPQNVIRTYEIRQLLPPTEHDVLP